MIVEHQFASMQQLADALAECLIVLTATSLSEQSAQPLGILSGGQTPQALFAALVQHHPDWSNLRVTLTDERCLPDTDANSNSAQLKLQLLSRLRHPPVLIDLLQQPDLSGPIVWAVVGMGLDGHSASLFPQDVDITRHLQSASAFVSVAPAGSPCVARVSLTPGVLKQAQALFLLIQGEDKWRVYQQAKADLLAVTQMPIRALLSQPQMQVYWAP
jgi:6-phosphogluconolactonase